LSSYVFLRRRRSLRERSSGDIQIQISAPRSLGSWCIKETDESVIRVDSSVPLMHYDPSHDLGSLIRIQITPKERTFRENYTFVYRRSYMFLASIWSSLCRSMFWLFFISRVLDSNVAVFAQLSSVTVLHTVYTIGRIGSGLSSGAIVLLNDAMN